MIRPARREVVNDVDAWLERLEESMASIQIEAHYNNECFSTLEAKLVEKRSLDALRFPIFYGGEALGPQEEEEQGAEVENEEMKRMKKWRNSGNHSRYKILCFVSVLYFILFCLL